MKVNLIDYNETFTPVARISSFKFKIAHANQFNLMALKVFFLIVY